VRKKFILNLLVGDVSPSSNILLYFVFKDSTILSQK